ncbi:MAG: LytR C-terminal domain-containing protein [Actinomycetes bacterium]
MLVRKVLKTPVTLLALLALALFAAAWGWDNARRPIPPRPPEPCHWITVGPHFTPDHAIIRVLNATGDNGVARRVAAVLRASGFRVIKVGNADANENGVRVVGVAPNSPEVVLTLGQFEKPKVVADQRPDHTVDIFVGKGYALKAKPLASVPVKDGRACVPVLPSGATSG